MTNRTLAMNRTCFVLMAFMIFLTVSAGGGWAGESITVPAIISCWKAEIEGKERDVCTHPGLLAGKCESGDVFAFSEPETGWYCEKNIPELPTDVLINGQECMLLCTGTHMTFINGEQYRECNYYCK